MAKRCQIIGKGAQAGNNVSHANNRTRRRFLPNMQVVSFQSESLGRLQLRVSTQAIRTIEVNGGLDTFLFSRSAAKLSPEARSLRRRIEKARLSVQS